MINQKRKITKNLVASAESRAREYVVWDSAIAGFGLRIRPSGARSYVFVYRTPGGRSGAVKRVTIKATNPDSAREEAKRLSARYHGGADPAAEKADEKREAGRTKLVPDVAAILDRFIKYHARSELKKKTSDEYERIVEKILKPRVGRMKIADLAPKDVSEMYREMRDTPTQAAVAVRVLSSAMSWAEEAGLRPPGPNPAGIRLKGSRKRNRLFSDAEVSRLLSTIDAMEEEKKMLPAVALALRLLFATGCRAGEICDLQWPNVDMDEGLMRWGDSKTGWLEKPITDEARALLEKAERIVGVPWVCPSPFFKRLRVETLEAGFERAMSKAKVSANENATLHLIRHWFSTKTYTDKQIPLALQMAVVGHKSVATAMRYTHVSREELKQAGKEAAERRAAQIKAAEKEGRVVVLRPEK